MGECGGMRLFKYVFAVILLLIAGCQQGGFVDRKNFVAEITKICKDKYQTYVVAKAVGDTVWVYLSYTPGRGGLAGTKQKDNNLFVEYQINSFNPFRLLDPPELKFVVQKIIRQICDLLLRCKNPYKFFVLVYTDISNPLNFTDQWHIGYIEDIKHFAVGKDFSGEGYSRLVWEPIVLKKEDGAEASPCFTDAQGKHVDYHDITLREFVEKQIKWRIYKRFSIEYNKTPFDLSAKERREEVFKIIQVVLKAYNFKEFEKFSLRDTTFLDESGFYNEFPRKDIENAYYRGITRKPAF
jgi:hypothetical protein